MRWAHIVRGGFFRDDDLQEEPRSLCGDRGKVGGGHSARRQAGSAPGTGCCVYAFSSSWKSHACIVLVMSLLLSGCDGSAATGLTDSSQLLELSRLLALWSLNWFVPGILLWIFIARDRPATQLVQGSGWSPQTGYISVSTLVYTGGTIKGNPKRAVFMLQFWLAAYPISFFFLPIWSWMRESALTGYPNLDWVLSNILVPAGVVVLLGWLITRVRSSLSPFCRGLVMLWKVVIGLGVLNLSFWVIWIVVEWLLKKTT